MSYTVFARKYRPQTFDDVIGQEHITRTLKNAIEQRRLAHAWIFVGPRGTGKTSTARILAKSLNCQRSDGPTTKPCGECDACREIAAGNSLDVLEFDAASNTQVDKVRELIIDNVKYAPANGRYKVYIVDEVHMLSTSSFNALLKTLEEPPEHVKFVFATTDVQKVPTTILSRCQRFDLKRIPAPLISGHLLGIAQKEKIQLSQAAAETIAHGAEGGMRDAESMLDQLVAFCGNTIEEADVLSVFGLTAHQTVAQLCDHIISTETPAALALLQAQAEAGRDLARLMSDLIGHLRNLLVAQADPDTLSDEETAQAVQEFIEQASRVRPEKLLDLIEQFAGAEARMRWAPNRKMHFEIAIIRAVQTLSQATLSEVLDTLGAMRGGGAPPDRNAVVAKPARAPAPAPAKREAAPAPRAEIIAETAPAKAEPREAAAVVEQKPEPVPPPAKPEPAPAPALRSLQECWPQLLETVRERRGLIASWIEAATLLGVEDDIATLGFPAEQKLFAEYIQQPNNRSFLEALITELTGQGIELKCRVDASVIAKAVEAPKLKPPADPVAEFRDDPLIQRALEIFRGQIQTA